jgi:N-acetylmuramoyl-L-alanine amidase
MTGSFNDYKDAVLYSKEMKARGFNDAFIVTYKDGEKVALNISIKKNNKKIIEKQKKTTRNIKVDVSFRIQIGVFKDNLSAKDLEKLTKISNLTKEPSGNFYKYYSSSFNNFLDASSELEMIKLAGFADAFMIAQKNGVLISIEKARTLLNNN